MNVRLSSPEMAREPYPTLKHLWLEDDLKYALIQTETGLKLYPNNITLPILKSILTRALERFHDILQSSPTTAKKEAEE